MPTVIHAQTLIEVHSSGRRLRPHSLGGNLKGHYAIAVSGNWRVSFRFEDGDVVDVDYLSVAESTHGILAVGRAFGVLSVLSLLSGPIVTGPVVESTAGACRGKRSRLPGHRVGISL